MADLMTRRTLRYPLAVLICIIIGWAGYRVERHYYKLNDGFSVQGISAPMTYKAAWDTAALDTEKHSQIQSILCQRFTYLAKGTQSFVFVSEDGRYVLKFFKQAHLRLPWYRELASGIPVVNQIVQNKTRRREAKQEKIYSGCKLAYEAMQPETGLFYLHLNPTTDLPTALTLIDKQGSVHVVNPNELSFYLQLKGTPLFALFLDFKDHHDLVGAQAALSKVFDYLITRSRRGILDRDPAYAQNLGFLGDQAGNLDVGNLVEDPLIRNPIEYRRRIQEYLVDLRTWLVNWYPELVPAYDERLSAL